VVSLGHGFTLLLGGARSGKSDLAVQLGEAWSGPVTFIATAEAGDDDMAERIHRHQLERPRDWQLIEAPGLDASQVRAVAPESLLILDCITLLVSNLMFAGHDEQAVHATVAQLGTALAERESPSLVITNEVGLGIHPETKLGRAYRDLLGRCNRSLASASETALFVAAGKVLPLHDLTVTW